MATREKTMLQLFTERNNLGQVSAPIAKVYLESYKSEV